MMKVRRKPKYPCHIMTTVRPLNKDGIWGRKVKGICLDENGEPVLTKNGKQKQGR